MSAEQSGAPVPTQVYEQRLTSAAAIMLPHYRYLERSIEETAGAAVAAGEPVSEELHRLYARVQEQIRSCVAQLQERGD